MRMEDQEESQNVEDARGSSGGGFQFRPLHGIGLGGVALALIGGAARYRRATAYRRRPRLGNVECLNAPPASAPPGLENGPAARSAPSPRR